MRLSQRQVALALLAVQALGVLMLVLVGLFNVTDPLSLLSTSIATVFAFILWIAYWRGWEPALPITVFLASIAVPLSLPQNVLSAGTSVFALLAPILALVLSNPRNIILSGVLTYGLLVWRAGLASDWASPQNMIGFTICLTGLFFGRLVLDTALNNAERQARQAEAARIAAEYQAETLDRQARALEQRNTEQYNLLALLETLEVPAVRLADGVIFVPIVGNLDSKRTDALTARLLEVTHTQRARYVLLDIAGVPVIDSRVAGALLNTAQALRLLGCTVALSGISSAVAITLSHEQLDLRQVRTVRDPAEALAYFQDMRQHAA